MELQARTGVEGFDAARHGEFGRFAARPGIAGKALLCGTWAGEA